MTLQEHYNSIVGGKGNKAQFLKQARHLFPQHITNLLDFDTTVNVLKSKQIISEAKAGGVVGKGFDIWDWKKILAEETKSVEKNVSKEVEDYRKNAYDNADMKNADNVNFNEIMKGFYLELKDPKNHDKTVDELKAMVVKNLAKDALHYTKEGMFGVEGVGYTDEAPGLKQPKEPKGKHKSSGYGDLDVDVEKVKANVQDTLGNKEAKTSMPKKVKEMPVASQNASGVKKMPMPGKEKKIKLQEGINSYNNMSDQEIIDWAKDDGFDEGFIELDDKGNLVNRNELLKYILGKEVDNSGEVEDFDYDTRDKEIDWDENDLDPAGGRGLSSHLEESKVRSLIAKLIKEELNEYGEDSGGQDMTYGMYSRSSTRKDQGNKDFIDKGYEDFYDDVPFEACPYESGFNKYYNADIAKLWQMGWKKAEAEAEDQLPPTADKDIPFQGMTEESKVRSLIAKLIKEELK